jgi:hypothetical protein
MLDIPAIKKELQKHSFSNFPQVASDLISKHSGLSDMTIRNLAKAEIATSTSLYLTKALRLIFKTGSYNLKNFTGQALEDNNPSFLDSLTITNIPNMFAAIDDKGDVTQLLFLRNVSWVKEFLSAYIYLPASDKLIVLTSISSAGEVDLLLNDLNSCFANLGIIFNGFWSSKSNRAEALMTIRAREDIAAFYNNKIEHIAHYFLNFLGPLCKHMSSSIYNDNQLIFISTTNSWFLGEEFNQIIPRVEGYKKHENGIILVRSLSDCLKLCTRLDIGLFIVHGACVTRKIPEAINSYFSTESLIYSKASSTTDKAHTSPILKIGVGLRSGTRSVINIADLLIELASQLCRESNQNVEFVLDGMCSANPSGEHETTKLLSKDEEHLLAEEIKHQMGALGIKCISIVGLTLMEQLDALSKCHLVITCSGSGSTKYLWSLNKPTITLNYPYHHSHERYLSQDDQDADEGIGLLQGRAFREEYHTPEWYLKKEMCSPVDIETLGSFRPNSIINIPPSVAAIKEIIRTCIDAGHVCSLI